MVRPRGEPVGVRAGRERRADAFATDYMQTHDDRGRLRGHAGVLDQLKVFLSQRNIQPGIAEWLSDRDLIQSKLQQEIVNLKFGVEQGDQIEMRRDPVVQRAMEALARYGAVARRDCAGT